MISNTKITAQPEYDIQFWNAMRNKEAREDILAKGRDISTGTYSMPTVAAGKVMNDDVISLYFSVDKEYRRKGIWLMNDKTALALRKLKDNDSNYLWNQANDTILGKQVIISEYMPDIEAGTKPIAFDDFSYYWIVGRKPVTVRTLLEKFVLYDQIGYLAFEFLDGKLVRNEAIKVIQMADVGK